MYFSILQETIYCKRIRLAYIFCSMKFYSCLQTDGAPVCQVLRLQTTFISGTYMFACWSYANELEPSTQSFKTLI